MPSWAAARSASSGWFTAGWGGSPATVTVRPSPSAAVSVASSAVMANVSVTGTRPVSLSYSRSSLDSTGAAACTSSRLRVPNIPPPR